MPWWTLAALALFVLVVCAGAAVAIAAFFQMRRLTTAGTDVARGLEEVAAKTEVLQARLEHAEQRAELVERKMAKLNGSFERLSTLTWALGDVRRVVAQVTDAVTLRK
jgi:hypothetical protein